MAVKVTLKNVRLGPHPQLYNARQYKGQGAFNYEATFLVDPKSEAGEAIQKAYKECAQEAWKEKATAKMAEFKGNKLQTFLLNGDTKADQDGFAGKLIVKAKRKQAEGRPDLRIKINGESKPLAEADGKPYGGCYVHAILEVWAQTKDNPGMRCKLLGMMFYKDGDAFLGGSSATDEDFDALGEGDDDAPEIAADEAGGLV